MFLRLFPVFLILLLQSCASDSHRVKERPNFSLSGAAATEEIKKFEIDKISYHSAHYKEEKWNQTAKREELNETYGPEVSILETLQFQKLQVYH